MGFTIVIYFCVAIIGILLFGGAIESSILLNFGNIVNPKTLGPYWECTIIQIAFMIVLVCHIPFIFFAGKEGMCIIIDETQRKSISNVLFHKLQVIPEFAKESMAMTAPNPDLALPYSDVIDRNSVGAEDFKKSCIN